MCLGHVEVVWLDGHGVENRRHKVLALIPPTTSRQLNPDPQLGNRDCGDRDVIAVTDSLSQCNVAPLGVDQDRRIEDQSCQGSAWGSMLSRS